MLIALANLRHSASRLVAAAIAIAIATAFVTAGLLANRAVDQTLLNSLALQHGAADLVITHNGPDAISGGRTPWSKEVSPVITAVEGVDGLFGRQSTGTSIRSHSRREWVWVQSSSPDARFNPYVMSAGQPPSGEDEVALAASTANRLGVAVGDSLTLDLPTASPDAADPNPATPKSEGMPITVTGLFDDAAYNLFSSAHLLVTSGLADRLEAAPANQLLVALAPGTDPVEVASTIAAALTAAGQPAAASLDATTGPALNTVLTPETEARQRLNDELGSRLLLAGLFYGFAALAVVVAGLVISNTFQVLIAQRRRTLALLRCVGASRGQIRRSVVAEATVTGLVASAIGVAVGSTLVEGALAIASRLYPNVHLPATVSLTPWTVVVPILVGTLMTVAASLVPARLATRVSPLEALRPQSAPAVQTGAGRLRLVIALVLGLGGALLLGGAVAAAVTVENANSYVVMLAAGVLGAALCAIGIIIGTVFWLPPVVGRIAGLVAKTGPGARIAAANTVRHPRRTAATATALLIGVALIATVSTGAASVTRTANDTIDRLRPVDIALGNITATTTEADLAPLPSALVAAVPGVDGIQSVAALRSAVVQVGSTAAATVGVVPDTLRQAVHRLDWLDHISPGTVLVAAWAADGLGLKTGDRVEVAGSAGSRQLLVDVADPDTALISTLILHQDDFATLAGAGVVETLWAALTPTADADTVVNDLHNLADKVAGDTAVVIGGTAQSRAMLNQVVDTLVLIVFTLLAVAVLIAIVGIANTLSLSVIERRAESALLRALGLTRGQMRGMLALEGIVIAGVTALLGLVIGIPFGLAGATLVLADTSTRALAVNPLHLGLGLALAIVAGLLASILPGRRAANTPPAAALAVE